MFLSADTFVFSCHLFSRRHIYKKFPVLSFPRCLIKLGFAFTPSPVSDAWFISGMPIAITCVPLTSRFALCGTLPFARVENLPPGESE